MRGFTTTGKPIMGMTYEIEVKESGLGEWHFERAKVVGKLYGRSIQDVIGLIVEWEDGKRSHCPVFGPEDVPEFVRVPS